MFHVTAARLNSSRRNRLGRLTPTPIDRHPRLDLRMTGLPTPPANKSWTRRMPMGLGMMLNDRVGDCTCAAMAHAIQVMTFNESGVMRTVPDRQVLKAYEALTGYNPFTGSGDTGAAESAALALWRKQGVGGDRCAAYGRIDPSDVTRIKQAIDLFGFVYVGTLVPRQWMSAPAVWSSVRNPQVVGGHAIIYTGWNAEGFELVSWGQVFHITYAGHRQFVDEVWGVLSHDWVEADRVSPSGLDWKGLLADMQALGLDAA